MSSLALAYMFLTVEILLLVAGALWVYGALEPDWGEFDWRQVIGVAAYCFVFAAVAFVWVHPWVAAHLVYLESR